MPRAGCGGGMLECSGENEWDKEKQAWNKDVKSWRNKQTEDKLEDKVGGGGVESKRKQ